MNCPKNVVPAGWVGLLGLFALSERSTISAFGPAASGSVASISPAGRPSSPRADSTFAGLGEGRQTEHASEAIGGGPGWAAAESERRRRVRRIDRDRPGAQSERSEEPLAREC